MTAPWRPLTEALIRALEPELPPGFNARLDATVGGIALFAPDAPDAPVGVGVRPLLEQPGDERWLIEVACRSVLSNTQDLIARSTAAPWPGVGSQMPLPEVEVTDTEIRLWYGDRETPTLALGPIPWYPIRG